MAKLYGKKRLRHHIASLLYNRTRSKSLEMTTPDTNRPIANEVWATRLRNRESQGLGVRDAAMPAPRPGCMIKNGAIRLPTPTVSAGKSVGS
jgi:hypothetical protein